MISKIKFWIYADRIGPDIPLTHILLHFKKSQYFLCKKKFSKFGENSEFRAGAYAICTKSIAIGDRVVIRPGSMLFASSDLREQKIHIVIEDDVLIGSSCHIYTSNHNYHSLDRVISLQGHSSVKPVILKRGCWVGANVTILPGVIIGENAVVGAGSVVTKSVPAYTIFAGNPAKLVKKLNGPNV